MTKKTKAFHTNDSPNGMGDYYGSGIRNKTAKVKEEEFESPKMQKKKRKKITLA